MKSASRLEQRQQLFRYVSVCLIQHRIVGVTAYSSPLSFPLHPYHQALRRVPARGLATAAKAVPKMVYPAYLTNAPVTEITKTKSNGIRVASEVSAVQIRLICSAIFLFLTI